MASFKVFALAFSAIAISMCSADISPRLTDATWAEEGQFPYQISIKPLSVPNRGPVFCSGTVIASYWILTSASCIVGSPLFEIRYDSLLHYTSGTTIDSHTTYIHPFFNSTNNQFNVGLIFTGRTAIPVRHVLRFLPTSMVNLDLTNRAAVVSGWGRLNHNFLVSPVLQSANGRIARSTSDQCRLNWAGSANDRNDVMCAIFNTQSGCTGDTGSPLVIYERRVWYLVGVAAFDTTTNSCRNSASLFTPLYSFREWVRNVTQLSFG